MTELKTAGQTSELQCARILILCFVPFLFPQNNQFSFIAIFINIPLFLTLSFFYERGEC